jgi:hypothetical protein
MSFKFCALCIEILDVLKKLSLQSSVSEKAHNDPPQTTIAKIKREQQTGHLRTSKKYNELRTTGVQSYGQK